MKHTPKYLAIELRELADILDKCEAALECKNLLSLINLERIGLLLSAIWLVWS